MLPKLSRTMPIIDQQRKSGSISYGFSLLELMAVITILGIIVAITITRIVQSTEVAKAKTCYHNRVELNSALERFAVTTGDFATALTDVNTPEYFPAGIPTCSVSENSYTLNTTTHRVEGHTNAGDH